MQTPLFQGVVADWYKQRLRHIYRQKPRCEYLNSINHLLGTCATCGIGKYATSKKVSIQQIAVNRIYTLLVRSQDDLQNLVFAVSRWPMLQTNLEYPLPIVRYHTSVHIPAMVDLASKTVIDFLPHTSTGRYIAKETAAAMKEIGFSYIAFTDRVESFSNLDPVGSRNQQIVDKLRELLQGDPF